MIEYFGEKKYLLIFTILFIIVIFVISLIVTDIIEGVGTWRLSPT